MPYRYLEHVGDAAIEGSGRTLEEAFAGAADAMLGIMVRGPVGGVTGRRVAVEAEAESEGELLVAFLNELLARQGLLGIVFFRCAVKEIRRSGRGRFVVRAGAEGLPPAALEGKLGAEVKAASYMGLKVGKRGGRFVVRCVLDL